MSNKVNRPDVESCALTDNLICNPVAYLIQGHYMETMTTKQRKEIEVLIAHSEEMHEILSQTLSFLKSEWLAADGSRQIMLASIIGPIDRILKNIENGIK